MQRAGRRISIIGHSQGGMVPRWALRFWPDTRAMVDDQIGFAPSNHGTTGRAIHLHHQLRAGRSGSSATTPSSSRRSTPTRRPSLGSPTPRCTRHTDEIVTPNSDDTGSSSLHGGGGQITNVAIQDVCPADSSEHHGVGTQDTRAYDLAVDALDSPGPG